MMLTEYLKDRKGNKVGVLVSQRIGKTIRYGVSKCNKVDTFDKNLGLALAMERLINGEVKNIKNVPASSHKQFVQFKARSKRYFFNPNNKGNTKKSGKKK